jgi:hypothetical protein
MLKYKNLQKDIQSSVRSVLSETSVTRTNSKIRGKVRMLFFMAGLAGMGFFMNSCVAGYVGSEPIYVESFRPTAPSNVHVWIDGDWGWNFQRHVYVQKTGYWVKPRQGQAFVSGSWKSTPNGKSWSKGHWQRQNNQEDSRRR